MNKGRQEYKLKVFELVKGSWKPFCMKYHMNVLVVILIGLIVGGYTFNTRFLSIGNEATVQERITTINTGNANFESVEDFLKSMEIIQIDPDMSKSGNQYTKGVFSVFFNQITHSGSLIFGVLNGVNKLLFNGSVSRSIVIFAAVLAVLLFTILFQNVMIYI